MAPIFLENLDEPPKHLSPSPGFSQVNPMSTRGQECSEMVSVKQPCARLQNVSITHLFLDAWHSVQPLPHQHRGGQRGSVSAYFSPLYYKYCLHFKTTLSLLCVTMKWNMLQGLQLIMATVQVIVFMMKSFAEYNLMNPLFKKKIVKKITGTISVPLPPWPTRSLSGAHWLRTAALDYYHTQSWI